MPNNFTNRILEEKLKRDKQNKLIIYLFLVTSLIILSFFFYSFYLKDFLVHYELSKNNNLLNNEESINAEQERETIKDRSHVQRQENNIISSENDFKQKDYNINEKIINPDIPDQNNQKLAKKKVQEEYSYEELNNDCKIFLVKDEECNLDNVIIKYIDNYKRNLKLELEKKNSEHFFPEIVKNINKLKTESLNHFSSNEKIDAYKKIKLTNMESEQVINNLNDLFIRELDNAKKFFLNSNYELASNAIAKASLVNAEDKDLLFISKRIKVLPEVKKLEHKLAKAEIENKIKEEILVLKEILKLDSNYEAYEQKLAQLEEILREKEYSSAIVEGYKHIENRDIVKANNEAQKAYVINPEGLELKDLFIKITDSKRDIDLNKNLKYANQSIKEDDWEFALLYFSEAVKIDVRSKISQEGVELSKKIISTKKKIESFLNMPERLTSKNVKEFALKVLNISYSISENSSSLKNKEKELENIISLTELPVEVTILSDGDTEIIVQGVGIVGKTLNKVIILKPGTYNFEGRKRGYKTKLLKVDIKLGQNQKNIEIICDEPI